MKHAASILCSLFLSGVYCARIDKFSMQGETERLKARNSLARMDKSWEMDDTYGSDYDSTSMYPKSYRPSYGSASEKWKQSNLPSFGEFSATSFGDYSTTTLGEIYRKIVGGEESGSVTTFHDLPSFVDPVPVGTVTDTYASGTLSYENVYFYGLQSAYKAHVLVDTIFNRATVKLFLKSGHIKGQYTADNEIQKTSGNFEIKMTGDIAYLLHYTYHVTDGRTELTPLSGEFEFGSVDYKYANIGAFSRMFHRGVGRILTRAVYDKVYAEVSHKLYSNVMHYVDELRQHSTDINVSGLLKKRISKVVNKIRDEMSQSTSYPTIDLSSNDKEFAYRQLHAKISGVKLHGMEKFFMSANEVTNDEDNVQAKIQLAVAKPTATAIVSIHNINDESAPFRTISVDFDMDKVGAELALYKRPDFSGMQLRDIKTYVTNVKPSASENYESELNQLVREKLTSHVQRYIEEGLKNFIRAEMMGIAPQRKSAA